MNSPPLSTTTIFSTPECVKHVSERDRTTCFGIRFFTKHATGNIVPAETHDNAICQLFGSGTHQIVERKRSHSSRGFHRSFVVTNCHANGTLPGAYSTAAFDALPSINIRRNCPAHGRCPSPRCALRAYRLTSGRIFATISSRKSLGTFSLIYWCPVLSLS